MERMWIQEANEQPQVSPYGTWATQRKIDGKKEDERGRETLTAWMVVGTETKKKKKKKKTGLEKCSSCKNVKAESFWWAKEIQVPGK